MIGLRDDETAAARAVRQVGWRFGLTGIGGDRPRRRAGWARSVPGRRRRAPTAGSRACRSPCPVGLATSAVVETHPAARDAARARRGPGALQPRCSVSPPARASSWRSRGLAAGARAGSPVSSARWAAGCCRARRRRGVAPVTSSRCPAWCSAPTRCGAGRCAASRRGTSNVRRGHGRDRRPASWTDPIGQRRPREPRALGRRWAGRGVGTSSTFVRPEPARRTRPPSPAGKARPELSIRTVMQEPPRATPIAVFVGLDSAPDARTERVALALAEMDRTDAWSRSLLMLISPTGTGYVNYVAVAAAQYMTRGDVATVTLQYSKRPSPLSLGKIGQAKEQNRLLWLKILERVRAMQPENRPQGRASSASRSARTRARRRSRAGARSARRRSASTAPCGSVRRRRARGGTSSSVATAPTSTRASSRWSTTTSSSSRLGDRRARSTCATCC